MKQQHLPGGAFNCRPASPLLLVRVVDAELPDRALGRLVLLQRQDDGTGNWIGDAETAS